MFLPSAIILRDITVISLRAAGYKRPLLSSSVFVAVSLCLSAVCYWQQLCCH